MTRASLLALAADCERMAWEGMTLGEAAAFVIRGEAAERALGPLPNDLHERAAALRAMAEEAPHE